MLKPGEWTTWTGPYWELVLHEEQWARLKGSTRPIGQHVLPVRPGDQILLTADGDFAGWAPGFTPPP